MTKTAKIRKELMKSTEGIKSIEGYFLDYSSSYPVVLVNEIIEKKEEN